MPKVKSYSAAWLSKHAPGHQLFEPSADSLRSRALSPAGASRKKQPPGPRRTIAARGTEVFVASGKDIRWGDLAYLKEEWIKQSRGKHGPRIKREDSYQSPDDGPELENAAGMRTIKTRCAEDIRQLVMSPNSTFLAILTTYTVHICVLPDSTHLTSDDTSPLKPKIFTLGPTTHVTSRSPVVSALWHPLGVNGSCLVTVTADSVVRLWEISVSSRWSFDSPTTSIDLKKLANGMSLDQDFSASTTATNKGFSADLFDLEVASASFPGKGSGGWDPMTLWLAMRGGDVYALCPLLPQRWAPPPTLIPSLSVSIVTTMGSIEDDPEISEQEKLLAQQQMEWMGDIDSQEPLVAEGPPGEPYIEIYNRPSRPGIVPRLQGPFELESDPETGDDLDTSITDLLVIGKKTETADLMMGEDLDLDMDDGDQEGLSLTVVCLLSTSGQVRIYLDMDGVQAWWLPPKNKPRLSRILSEATPAPLLAFQAFDTMSPVEVSEESWPMFSGDVMSRYSFFVTHHAGIVHASLTSWIFRLESELNGDSEAGTDFRVGLLVNSQSSRERIYSQPTADTSQPLAGAVALRDPDTGYFLLSSTPFDPIALTFETPDDDFTPIKQEETVYEHETSITPLDFYEPRPVYQPSQTFDETSALPMLLDRLRTSRYKTTINQEVRLSPLTLSIFTDAHKVLSDETYRLGVAAAELFRRCEMLQSELRLQVDKANQVRTKIDAINGGDRDGEADYHLYPRRVQEARDRQDKLARRLERLRKIVGKASTRELSAKEIAFADEVSSVEASISKPTDGRQENKSPAMQLWKRLEDATRLQAELLDEVETIKDGGDAEASLGMSQLRIPQDIRRSKLQQVQGLLSRETALVEAVTARLERLQTST